MIDIGTYELANLPEGNLVSVAVVLRLLATAEWQKLRNTFPS